MYLQMQRILLRGAAVINGGPAPYARLPCRSYMRINNIGVVIPPVRNK